MDGPYVARGSWRDVELRLSGACDLCAWDPSSINGMQVYIAGLGHRCAARIAFSNCAFDPTIDTLKPKRFSYYNRLKEYISIFSILSMFSSDSKIDQNVALWMYC